MTALKCNDCKKEISQTDLNKCDEWGYPLYYQAYDNKNAVICKKCLDKNTK
jgi:hypothetical protein